MATRGKMCLPTTRDIVSVSDQRSGLRLDDREHILGGRTIQNNRSLGDTFKLYAVDGGH